MRPFAVVLALLAVSAVPAAAGAQGVTDYLNFESPQVKPIAVAELAGFDYLLACNTPDNSVEIYDVTGTGMTFLHRVPVGQEPVSVVWVPSLGAFYTCNMVGDSVTKVIVTAGATSGELEFRVDATVFVGDEPVHLVHYPEFFIFPERLVIALHSRSAAVITDVDLGNPETVLLSDTVIDPSLVIHKPRRLLHLEGSVVALDLERGALDLARYFGPIDDEQPVNLDAPLGTANFNLALGTGFDAGDIYVVASDSRNETRLEENVAAEDFGFTHSVLYRIQGPLIGDVAVERRNLNAESFTVNDPDGVEVPFERAVSQPMDVVPYYDAQGDVRLYITSFGTDRVVTVDNLTDGVTRNPPEEWAVDVIDVPLAPGSPNRIAGPRGLAVKYGDALAEDRIFVLNRLENSITSIDPTGLTAVTTTALQHDPTPGYIRHGRKLLYDAKLSGRGFVSCASCHIDGRLDGLRWDLGTVLADPEPIPEALFDGFVEDPAPTEFLNEKNIMVTQSLQGLVNWEAELDRPAGRLTQTYFSNAPYHWRGDRADFRAFGPAFQGLLEAPNPIPAADMEAFEKFVNSIAYPPNPEQPFIREFSGELGEPDLIRDPQTDEVLGSGGKLGLKAFHIVPTTAERSCVHCHSLPEGSSNKIPQFSVPPPNGVSPGNGPSLAGNGTEVVIEVPSLRNMRPKEPLLEAVGDPIDFSGQGIQTGGIGLLRASSVLSIDMFLAFFDQHFDTNDPAFPVTGAVRDFLRELDTGTAPMVGFTVTFTSQSAGSSSPVVQGMEDQAQKGNIGIAVHGWIDGVYRGFWYDQSSAGDVGYREIFVTDDGDVLWEYSGAGGLFGLMAAPDDRLIFQATPLGSARRIAHPTGSPPPVVTTPTLRRAHRVTLDRWLDMSPNTAYASVPEMTRNWSPFDPDVPLTADPVPERLVILRLMQYGLGEPPRHDPTRRFRIAGTGIRHGAVLEVRIGGATSNDPLTLRLPIYATGDTRGDHRIWTTAIEAEPFWTYVWMLGGTGARGVKSVLDGSILESLDPARFPDTEGLAPGTFDRRANRHDIRVVNPDGTRGTATNVAIELDG